MRKSPLRGNGREALFQRGVAAVFLVLALFSTLGLDYLNSKKGKQSFIFRPPAEKKALPVVAKKVPPPAPAKEEAAKPPAVRPKPVQEKKRKEGKVALIVDDMGNSLEALDEIVSWTKPVTVSVLPYSRFAVETAERARASGLEVMLHLPLESLNSQEEYSQTDGIILSAMGEDEVRRTLEEDLGQVPFIKGVNNHMGSKATADRALMAAILSPLKERGLFFIDSRTTGKTIAYDLAQEMGVASASRQVFLDSADDSNSVEQRLAELFGLARKNGAAIGICHPLEKTFRVLKDNLAVAENDSLEFVFVSELVHRP
jgi:polysaccharide deacetylase 2 family uncharacterized protein YibQ